MLYNICQMKIFLPLIECTKCFPYCWEFKCIHIHIYVKMKILKKQRWWANVYKSGMFYVSKRFRKTMKKVFILSLLMECLERKSFHSIHGHFVSKIFCSRLRFHIGQCKLYLACMNFKLLYFRSKRIHNEFIELDKQIT